MTDENEPRHIELHLGRRKRSMIVVSPVETFTRVETIGAPRRPHPCGPHVVLDSIRLGTTEVRAEIPEKSLPPVARSSLCVFTHQLALVVRTRGGDDAVMLLGPGWWQIVRRRDGVPTSITTRTGDATPALAAELVRSTTPVVVIGDSPTVPPGAGTVIWYPYAAFARYRRLIRLNLARSTRDSVRRALIGAGLALVLFVVAATSTYLRPSERFADASETPPRADSFPPHAAIASGRSDPTVAEELILLARALAGRFAAERIVFSDGTLTATGVLTHSTPSVLDHTGLVLRRIELIGAETRAVVAMDRSSLSPVSRPANRTLYSGFQDTVGGGPLSTVIRTIAESSAVTISALRHVDDDELVVTMLGSAGGILSVVFATDSIARIVRLTIEATDGLLQMMYVVTPGGSYDR